MAISVVERNKLPTLVKQKNPIAGFIFASVVLLLLLGCLFVGCIVSSGGWMPDEQDEQWSN